MSDDWEYSDCPCPKCSTDMATRTCGSCGGEGFVEDEDDWEGWDRDDTCETCNGQGHETWCRECGWDANFKCFLSPVYEQAFYAKQEQHSTLSDALRG